MKRITITIGMLLLLMAGIMFTVYTVRRNNADAQFVSKSSASILSFAVDDLIVDNFSSLLSWNNTPKATKQKKSWIKNIIFDAGISIPARIYLFSIGVQKTQFYGILAVKDYDKCFSFFTDHFPDGVDFINKENGTVSVDINSHVKILFDRNNLIYKIAPEQLEGFEDLESLMLQRDTWTQIGSFEGYEHALSKKHISYTQKDKGLKIEATVSKHKTEIDGNWLLSEKLEDNFQIRAIDTSNQTLIFWSLLPLNEVPVLSYLMRKYTGLNQELLDRNYDNYFDLQLKADHTTQRDSSISYVYDDDFNASEEIQVKETTVPNIAHAWRYNTSLAASLPNKMFYKFGKKRIDQYLLNTTSNTFPDQLKSKKTLYPLYCFIDFETWPEPWNVSVFKKLKDDKVKATISTLRQNERTLSIKGEIIY